MAPCAWRPARRARLRPAMTQHTDHRPVLLFGETYHHPNLFYRSGFLAPDPVVLVDKGGDDTTLWTSRLEEGRARKQATVKEVRCSEDLGLSELLKKVGS